MHQLLATAATTSTIGPTKPCVARGHPSCIRGFVRDRCRKCTLGSNACAMCHNHNQNHSSSSLPSPCVKSGNNKLELQQRLQRLSYNAPSLPISHIPPPRRSFDFESLSSSSELETSPSSSKDSSPRQSLLIEEEVKKNENGIKDKAEWTTRATSSSYAPSTPTSTASFTPAAQKLSSPRTTTTTITKTASVTPGSISPLSPSSTAPWTSPPSFSKSTGGSTSCIFCFNGRQVCEDCFGLGYVQRICQDCFKDQKQSSLSPQQLQPRRRHGASFSLSSLSRPSVSILSSSSPSPTSPTSPTTTTPSSTASAMLSLPWSGLGSRLKEQRWLSGLTLNMGGLTSPSTDSDALSATWTEVMSPEAKGEPTPSSPSSSSCDEQAPLRGRQRDRASIVWAEDVNDPPQTPRTPKWSASFSSSGMDAKDQGSREDDDDFVDFAENSTVFESKKPLHRSIATRGTRSSSSSSSSPPSFKTVVLKHLKVPATLFKTGQDAMTDNNDSISSSSSPPHQQESDRRPDGDKRKRWSVGFVNMGQSRFPSARLGVSTAREDGKQQEGLERIILSGSGSSSAQEENRARRGHRRYWSLSAISPNNLFGTTSTAA